MILLDDILYENQEAAVISNEILDEFVDKNMGAQMVSDLWIYSSLLKFVKPKNVLEFGCADGLTSAILADTIKRNNLDTKLYCFDIDAPSVERANETLKRYDINYECFVHDIFKPLPKHIDELDMVFIDADHGFVGGKAIIELLKGRVSKNFVYFVHDICYFSGSENPHGIYSVYEEWKAYLEGEDKIKDLKTILLTGKYMETSMYGGLIGHNKSKALIDGDLHKPGKKLGYSMLLSNYLEIV